MSIGQLAEAAGISRRAVRFYVQRGLLPPPVARGRGAHYEAAHVERLRQILRLQEAGHSLAAISALLAGGGLESGAAPAGLSSAPDAGPTPGEAPVRLRPELVIRLRLAEGVELHLDPALHNPDASVLLALREAVLGALRQGAPGSP